MKKNASYSLLVNTSDTFEDCWPPFFTLLAKYWPDLDAQVLLNTEKKVWATDVIDIKCLQVQDNSKTRLPWSDCLIRALDLIETPLVLYLQEDYFINKQVRHQLIEKSVQYMIENPNIEHIGLTKHGSHPPYKNYNPNWLLEIRQNARYRISTQAGLWRVDALKSYLREGENGWMFEIYGTWRARKRNGTFLCTQFDDNSGGPAIDYLHTGIIKGKWLPEIRETFRENNIVVDFSKRGFYKEPNPVARKLEVIKKLLERPTYFLKQVAGRF